MKYRESLRRLCQAWSDESSILRCSGSALFKFFYPNWPQTWTTAVKNVELLFGGNLMVLVFYVAYVEVYSSSVSRTPSCVAQNSSEVFPVIVPASHRDKDISETEDLSI